jgi:LPS sulfotransferase NodH
MQQDQNSLCMDLSKPNSLPCVPVAWSKSLGMFSKSIGMARMGIEYDVPVPATPTRKLLICTAPRTASGSLTSLIRESGLGQVSEYCSTLAERRFRMRSNSRVPVSKSKLSAEYLRTIMPLRTVQGVFAAKIQHAHVKRVIRAGLARELFDGADLVFLFRQDLRDQAVSYTVSLLTDNWSWQATEVDPSRFSDARLRREYMHQLRYLAYEYAEWHTIFNTLGVTCTELPSEQFVRQPAQTVRNLFQLVDASVDEAALAQAVENMDRYAGNQQLKRRLRDTIVPTVDHHDLLRARYLPADRMRLSIRNLFG